MMFVCKSKRLAGFLVSKGCNCIKVDSDRTNPNYLVFLFERNDTLLNAMKEWGYIS
jgi:hypothetical protein